MLRHSRHGGRVAHADVREGRAVTDQSYGIPTDTIDMLVDCWRAWSEIGAGLSEDQWKLPTDLPGWTVQDTLSHIIGTERFLEGLPLTTAPAGPADHVRNPIGEFNENEVAARRGLSGAEILAEWEELRATREATLANGDASFYAQPMATPTGPGTMADFLATRILDCWVHEQDVRRTLNMPGRLGGPAAEHSIDRLLGTIPIVVGKRAACPEGRAAVIRITGDVERELVCEVNRGRAGFVAQPATDSLCAITMDTSTFLALATGRTTASAVDDHIAISAGDPTGAELGRRVVDQLNMMI